VALAAKVVSSYVRRAGLAAVLGRAGAINVQGEEQQKLDVLANEVLKHVIQKTGRVCVTASEEDAEAVPVALEHRPGKYVLLFDPLDGSSNIDVNASIGTIFSVFRRVSPEGQPGTEQDCLQVGRKQVVAGYVIYGSSTILVYSAGPGSGVHGFTLDPRIGEFLLSHPNIVTPRSGRYYSVNESNYDRWSAGYREVVRVFKSRKNSRYIGSLVADFHRNLVTGGVFMYPADTKSPHGKMRLLYEAAPLALIAEAAGGAATDGQRPILDIVPTALHERTPLVIGSADDVAFVEETLARAAGAA
jgi:fructose-1,6-bisphosphatase I